MRILLTGASGLIGSALTLFLEKDGHKIFELARDGADPRSHRPSWDPAQGKINLAAAGSFDGVIHLAGENIAQRWTPAAKARIRDSRVAGTKLLSQALAGIAEKPQVLISEI